MTKPQEIEAAYAAAVGQWVRRTHYAVVDGKKGCVARSCRPRRGVVWEGCEQCVAALRGEVLAANALHFLRLDLASLGGLGANALARDIYALQQPYDVTIWNKFCALLGVAK